ncbi:hypothetical protein JTB14_031688 [Gonioctena quinquepunctata]|nr:hypothetical protein JTB14_031688 [Gonioctena quinquepunctata]
MHKMRAISMWSLRISANTEIKSRQQRVLLILDSKNIDYEAIDITGEDSDADREFMKNNATAFGGTMSDPHPKTPIPPQFFNNTEYCGDYDMFDIANEVGKMDIFLKLREENKDEDVKVSAAEVILEHQYTKCED